MFTHCFRLANKWINEALQCTLAVDEMWFLFSVCAGRWRSGWRRRWSRWIVSFQASGQAWWCCRSDLVLIFVVVVVAHIVCLVLIASCIISSLMIIWLIFSLLLFSFPSTPDGHLVKCHFLFCHGCGCCVKIENLPMASWSCVDKCRSVHVRERCASLRSQW